MTTYQQFRRELVQNMTKDQAETLLRVAGIPAGHRERVLSTDDPASATFDLLENNGTISAYNVSFLAGALDSFMLKQIVFKYCGSSAFVQTFQSESAVVGTKSAPTQSLYEFLSVLPFDKQTPEKMREEAFHLIVRISLAFEKMGNRITFKREYISQFGTRTIDADVTGASFFRDSLKGIPANEFITIFQDMDSFRAIGDAIEVMQRTLERNSKEKQMKVAESHTFKDALKLSMQQNVISERNVSAVLSFVDRQGLRTMDDFGSVIMEFSSLEDQGISSALHDKLKAIIASH